MKNNSYLILKKLIFILVFFPFIMHIYWGIFDIYYANNVMYIWIFLLFFLLFFKYIESDFEFIKNKEILYIFAIFLVLFLVNSYILGEYKDLMKYSAYIFSLLFLFNVFMQNKYFKLYINIVTFFTFTALILYFYYLLFPAPFSFIVDNLSLLTLDSSFVTREDWDYSIPYYLLVFPVNGLGANQLSILGLPRFFGMSTEPTLYSVVVLPTIIMALYFKKYFQALILFFGLLLASSLGALLFGIIGCMFYLFYRYKLSLFYVLIVLFFLGNFTGFYESLLSVSPRMNFYIGGVLNLFSLQSISLFADAGYENVQNIDSAKIFSLVSITLEYGLLQAASYLLIFYVYIKFTLITKSKLLFIFSIVSLLILNKSGESLSPLFLFYFSFIYSQYLIFKKSLNNKQVSVDNIVILPKINTQ